MILTSDQARAMILAGQGVTDQSADPIESVRRCVAVQTQYAASLPGAIAARCTKLRPGWDTKALEKGDLIKSWSIRNTVHTHAPDDYAMMLAALGAYRRRRYLHWMANDKSLGSPDVPLLEEQIMKALEAGPLDRKTLHQIVPAFKGMPMVGWGLDVMGLAYLGRVVMLSPAKGATKFKLVDQPQNLPTEGEALTMLLRRYLQTHAPATLSDFIYWAGIAVVSGKRAFEAMKNEIELVTVNGMKGERMMLRGTPVLEPSRHIRFLAKFDPILMGHKDKTLFIPEKLHKEIFRPAGQVEAVVLENGKITGVWRLERKGKNGVITVRSLANKCLVKRSGLDREIERLRSSLGLGKLDLRNSA